MEQTLLRFDSTGFETFETVQAFFAFSARTLRDQKGRPVLGKVIAADLDYSPSQWSQKLNEQNSTSITLNDADEYTELYGDTRWIEFAFWKHVIKKRRNRDELLRLRDEIEQQLREAV